MWINKLGGINQFSTAIALVTLGIGEVTHRTLAFDESVGKESSTLETELLVNNLLICLSTLVYIFENILSDHCLLGCCCSTKFVEIKVKPVVDFAMDFVVVVAYFLTCFTLLHCLSFCGGSILISSANVDGVVSS